MGKLLVLLLLLVWMFQANGASFPFIENYNLLIECGVKGKVTEHYNNQSWFPDSLFMDSGKIKQFNDASVPQFMTTLRYFPKQAALNCYNLPLTNTQKYIFRAGFYYANYDGKSQPPVFDLLLGGQPWQTVNSSATAAPIFHELIYTPKDGNISVCLKPSSQGGSGSGIGSGTPFISSLEATYLPHQDSLNQTVYTKMKNATAYHLLSRINFGSHQIIEPWSSGDCEEELNRYWMPQQAAGNYVNVSFGAISCAGSYYENRPPSSLLITAIAPQNASQSIHVPITFPTTTPRSAYIVLYFYQNLNASLNPIPNATRYMDIYVDGVMKANVKLETVRAIEVVTLYPVLVAGIANLTISPANGTILPPLLNGMEVFLATDLAEQPSSYGCKIHLSSSLIFQFFAALLFFVLG